MNKLNNQIEIVVQVRYKEVDRMGRVYHSNYFTWFDMARSEHLKKKGFSYKALEDSGCLFVVAEASCKYLISPEYDDELLVRTELKNVKNASFDFHYEVFNRSQNNCKVCEAKTRMAVVDKFGKIIKMPRELLDKIKV